MKTIVALVDLTDASAKVLNYTQELASALGSEVVLLHVMPMEFPVAAYGVEAPPIPIDPSPTRLRENESRMNEMLQVLSQGGITATALQARGPVASTVLNETSRLKADLVIMGSHHHSALYHLFVGSTTADVLKRAPFPVLVVPCDEPESGESQSQG